jgi:hypothetical protein
VHCRLGETPVKPHVGEHGLEILNVPGASKALATQAAHRRRCGGVRLLIDQHAEV